MHQLYRECFLKIVSGSLAFITFITYAANPASKEYVDQQAASLQAIAAGLQSQINNSLAVLRAQNNALNTIPAIAHPVGSC